MVADVVDPDGERWFGRIAERVVEELVR